jgi:hypothetical protein
MTLKSFFGNVGKFFVDLFTNVKGFGDLHKLMGYTFAITGLVAAIRPVNPIATLTFLAIEAVAGAFLGFSLIGDFQAIKSGDPARY